MKTNFQPNEVLTAEDLNANFQECAGKAPSQHGHEMISNENDSVSVRCGESALHIEVSTSDGGSEIELGLDEAINLSNVIKTPDSTPTENSNRIVTSGGVAAALNGKLDSNITEMSASAEHPINVSDMAVGKLVLIDQDEGNKLSQLIVTGLTTLGYIHFHLNSGELTNRFFLVRRFTWTVPGNIHHLIEVVGAWG